MLLACAAMLALLPCCCMAGVACTAAILSKRCLYLSLSLIKNKQPWPIRPGVTREGRCQPAFLKLRRWGDKGEG